MVYLLAVEAEKYVVSDPDVLQNKPNKPYLSLKPQRQVGSGSACL